MKLGTIAKVQGGYAFKSQEFQSEGVPIIRIGNLDGKNVEIDNDVCYPIAFWDKHPEFRVEKNNILIAMSGATVGKIGLYKSDNKALLNQRVCILKPDENAVTNEYLYFFCMSPTFKNSIKENAFGCAQPNISATQICDFEINVPDIETQKRWVSQLRKIKNIIDKREQELVELDNLIKSRFVEMFGEPEENTFGWDKMPLANVIINANNGMARRGNDEEGNIVMRLVELQDGYIDYSNPNRIVLSDNEKKRYLLKDKDFLFARVNGNPDNVGRCAVFHDIGEDAYHNDHIIRVHFNEGVLDGVFASALLNSYYGKKQLKSQIKTSAGQYTVSQDGIGAIVAILPPMELQEQFATFVEQVDKLKFFTINYTKLLHKGVNSFGN